MDSVMFLAAILSMEVGAWATVLSVVFYKSHFLILGVIALVAWGLFWMNVCFTRRW